MQRWQLQMTFRVNCRWKVNWHFGWQLLIQPLPREPGRVSLLRTLKRAVRIYDDSAIPALSIPKNTYLLIWSIFDRSTSFFRHHWQFLKGFRISWFVAVSKVAAVTIFARSDSWVHFRDTTPKLKRGHVVFAVNEIHLELWGLISRNNERNCSK